jgi:phosphate transport system substrate-binding protein
MGSTSGVFSGALGALLWAAAGRPPLAAVVLFMGAGMMSLAAAPSYADSRDQIIIVGSSTVYPFSAIVAEHFAKSGPFQRPTVQETSTRDGFRLFCAGSGADTPDIGNASRPMTVPERADCATNGVRRITEVRIGYDSLILVNLAGTARFAVTLDQLWRAVAKVVPINGALVPNPYRNWHDIAAELPDRAIKLFGPAAGHGTRDAFIELVMDPRCKASAPGSKLAPEERELACDAVRGDGRWTDVANLELILGKLAGNPQALGILTYSYLEQFRNRIQAMTIDGVVPSRATIPTGTYPISRPLFMYVKDAHLKTTTGLADYAAEFLSFCAAGAHGYLSDEGLVPMPASELLIQHGIVARLAR